MASQKVSFENANGERLAGVLEVPEGVIRAWALFAHCFSCSKNGLAASRVARALAASGIGTLRFDFAGLGQSQGDFGAAGFSGDVDDIVEAANWMASQGHPLQLLVGHSLGGAAVIVAAERLPDVKAVATLGAPSDADHVIAQFSEHVPTIESKGAANVNLAGRPFMLKKSFIDDVKAARVRDAAGRLKRPLLILHSPIDEIVGIDNATNLFVAAKHPKNFISLDDADHLLTDTKDALAAADMIGAWAGKYLSDAENETGSSPAQSNDVIVRETGENGPFQNEVFVNGRRYLADEPVRVGGSGSGPDPYEWLSAGLGACTAMTLRMYANRKKWPLDRVTVRLDHEKRHAEDCTDCEPGDKIDVFTRGILIEGDLDETQRARLIEIADRCPVHRTLEAEAVVKTVAVIE